MKNQEKIGLSIGSATGENVRNIGSFGINSCHAALWLREDLPRHFRRLREELGMRYVRCHGIFNDQLEAVAPDGSFHFEKPLTVLERILDNGQTPFLELSGMPGALARTEESVCHYRFRSAPPRDWRRWEELVEQFLHVLIERFGREELCRWYFEVWNEPDLPFWTGTQEEYFKLYDLSRAAIKRQDSRFRVGGPATSKTAWIADFCRHVSAPSPEDPSPGCRCDFVSTHAYPSDVAFLDGAEGEVRLQSADLLPRLLTRVRQTMKLLPEPVPLFLGEWNSSAGPLAFNHDECANAAFIVKTMAELRSVCAGSLFWNGSDIYEECGFHSAPFHGGYGLLNVNGIPKASFHAFRFLRAVSGEELSAAWSRPAKCLGALAAREQKTMRLLLWNYLDPEMENETFEIRIDGMKDGAVCEQVMPENGSAYESWLRQGAPEFASVAELSQLESASHPRRFRYSADAGISLAPGEIALVTFELPEMIEP